MDPIKAIVVDDEQLARRGLMLRLEASDKVKILAQCADGEQALQAIAEYQPELVFLDIQMPGLNGFDVIARLQADEMPMIIFVTAFDQYALDAFKVHAVDYLLKPIDDERLEEAIDRALAQRATRDAVNSKDKLMGMMMEMTGSSALEMENLLQQNPAEQYPDTLNIKDGSDIVRVNINDIEWVDAAGDYMCIHAGGQTHIMRKTMKELAGLLKPERFIRIHRSTIVNASLISAAKTLNNGEYMLTLANKKQLKVSRSYRDKIKNLLK
ncbi:MAG: LytTR family DNA-binding domain-containing protein [Cellvibrionaceae bacterium]|nr:LytTR family DNA-binding domain-containing protein [Cellvibrionaceae bacterium]